MVSFAKLRWAMEPALSPTGTEVAYVETGPDLTANRLGYTLRIHDLRSGTDRDVSADYPLRSPRYSPDGTLVAVLALTGDTWQPAVIDPAGDCHRGPNLACPIGAMDWSPEGTRLVAVGLEPDGTSRVYSMQVDSGRPGPAETICDGIRSARSPRWSADGTHIAFVADDASGSSLWVTNPAGSSAPRRLASGAGRLTAVAWSPTSDRLAYLGQKSRPEAWANSELWVFDASSGQEHQLGASLDRSIGQVVRGDDERAFHPPLVAWDPDGEHVIAAFADGGISGISRFGTDGSITPVAGGRRAILEFDVGGDALAFTWSDPDTPGEVAIVNRNGERTLSSLVSTLGPLPRVASHRLSSTQSAAEGWLTIPEEGEKPYPLVVQIHGGPHYPVGERFSYDARRLAAKGCAFLRLNPRGSQGYGIDHARALVGSWGNEDHADLMELIELAATRDDIDGDRIALMGESYGGFLTIWSIAHSRSFVAAVAENAVIDMTVGAKANPDFWANELGATLDEDFQRYVRMSPITYAERIETPLLLISAEKDEVCPPIQTERLHEVLTDLGRPVAVLRVPDEGHLVNLFGRPLGRVEKMKAIDRFLTGHLFPEPT